MQKITRLHVGRILLYFDGHDKKATRRLSFRGSFLGWYLCWLFLDAIRSTFAPAQQVSSHQLMMGQILAPGYCVSGSAASRSASGPVKCIQYLLLEIETVGSLRVEVVRIERERYTPPTPLPFNLWVTCRTYSNVNGTKFLVQPGTSYKLLALPLGQGPTPQLDLACLSGNLSWGVTDRLYQAGEPLARCSRPWGLVRHQGDEVGYP